MLDDLNEMRRAFGSYMTGVTVVTASSNNQEPIGFTANSFTSVSLQPPLLLVCPSKSLTSFPVFAECENFAVNVLAEDQRAIANTFASEKGDRFAQVDWRADAAGCPIIAGSAAAFSLRLHDRIDAGDHIVLIGEVTAYECSGKAGLGYSSEGYFSLGLERRAVDVPRSSDVTVGAIVSFGDKVLLRRSGETWYPPQVAAAERYGSLNTIRKYLEEADLEVSIGAVYSVFDQQNNGAISTYYRASIAAPPSSEFGELIAVSELEHLAYANSAIQDMMCRYALEYRQGNFGLYVGDETRGDVHTFSEGGQP